MGVEADTCGQHAVAVETAIKAAIRVVAGNGHAGVTADAAGAGDHDLAIRLHCKAAGAIEVGADHGHDLAVGAEGLIQYAGRGQPRETERIARAGPDLAGNQGAAVGLQGHRAAVVNVAEVNGGAAIDAISAIGRAVGGQAQQDDVGTVAQCAVAGQQDPAVGLQRQPEAAFDGTAGCGDQQFAVVAEAGVRLAAGVVAGKGELQ